MMLQWRKWYHDDDEALLLRMQVRGGEQSLIGFELDFSSLSGCQGVGRV
jgi:hypothetical protein